MAGAVTEGARAVLDIAVTIKCVPEEVAPKSNFKFDQVASIATIDELPQYDAIIFGTQ